MIVHSFLLKNLKFFIGKAKNALNKEFKIIIIKNI